MNELHSLTLRNDRAELARLMTWIDELAGQLELSPQAKYAVQLCLEEAIVNIISYAFEPGTENEMKISVWRDDRAVFAEITDQGRPFDPRAQKVQQRPADLASAHIGGLGITLIRNFAANVGYERADGTNRLTLSFVA